MKAWAYKLRPDVSTMNCMSLASPPGWDQKNQRDRPVLANFGHRDGSAAQRIFVWSKYGKIGRAHV